MELFRKVANTIAPGRFPPSPLPDPNRRMVAVVMREHGPPSVLQLDDSFPAPMPAPGTRHVLVQVCGAGLNPLDCKMRQGPIASFLYPKPKVCGLDISGKVVSAPSDSMFKQGDRVFAMLPLLGSQYGAYAGYCCVDESILALAPSSTDLMELATIPLVACTVIQALRPIVSAFNGQTAGRRCFVQAGSGGLGSFAVQYCARALSMHVIASCSPHNAELVRSLGAAETVDYHTERLEDRAQGMDVFFDSLGFLSEQQVFGSDSHIMRRRQHPDDPPSHYIRIASSPLGSSSSQSMGRDPLGLAVPEARIDRMAAGYLKQAWHSSTLGADVCYHFILVHPERRALEEAAALLQDGTLRPIVQQRFALAQAAKAHELLEQGHVVGKLVLEVDPSFA